LGKNYGRVLDFRNANGISEGRNIGLLDYNLGDESGTQFATSGRSFPGTAPAATGLFQTLDTGIGDPVRDSENKLLDWLGRKLLANPSLSGTAMLYTERPPCDSRAGVINQFMQRFGSRVALTVQYGPFMRYNYKEGIND